MLCTNPLQVSGIQGLTPMDPGTRSSAAASADAEKREPPPPSGGHGTAGPETARYRKLRWTPLQPDAALRQGGRDEAPAQTDALFRQPAEKNRSPVETGARAPRPNAVVGQKAPDQDGQESPRKRLRAIAAGRVAHVAPLGTTLLREGVPVGSTGARALRLSGNGKKAADCEHAELQTLVRQELRPRSTAGKRAHRSS